MILKRFYDNNLAQASFLIGCAQTSEAIVIDPNRDVEQYMEMAASEGLQITAVTETHIHADFVSGSRELAHLTGAKLYLSDEGDADWKYSFASEKNVTLVRDGDQIRIGRLRFDVIKTPGHTPEHITFVLTDEAASDRPAIAFTGDFVFVGEVGRPDLLERAANYKGTMEKGASTLYNSLLKFKDYPDYLMLLPSHGAGSACGKSLGGVPATTLGYEKDANWAFKANEESEFVRSILEGQPEPPRYFKEMKRINKVGPTILNGFKKPSRLGGRLILDLLNQDVSIVDIRDAGETATGFIPGLLNIPLTKSFTNWAGWLLSYDKPIYLLAKDEEDVIEAVRNLGMIGLDDVEGWFGTDALRAYEKERGNLPTIPQISSEETLQKLQNGEAGVLDIRGQTEWDDGHMPGATHIMLGYLEDRATEISKDKPWVVHCGGGVRSPIGISLLYKLGFRNLLNMPGGFAEYEQSKLPISTESDENATPVGSGKV